jgi:uncharacterized protein YdhG (YjbR/CyaY superfamily)
LGLTARIAGFKYCHMVIQGNEKPVRASMKASKDIDSYIASYPRKTQVLLKKMRAVICKAAPQATEAISYGVPTYKLNGNLVHFGGFKSHIGFFPTPSGIKHFQKELSAYKTSKGAVQFPIEKPIPVGLVAKIVKFRVKDNLRKHK